MSAAPDRVESQPGIFIKLQEAFIVNVELAKLRESKGFSISELARKSGVDRSLVNGYENYAIIPNGKTMIKLAKTLGIKDLETLEKVFIVKS